MHLGSTGGELIFVSLAGLTGLCLQWSESVFTGMWCHFIRFMLNGKWSHAFVVFKGIVTVSLPCDRLHLVDLKYCWPRRCFSHQAERVHYGMLMNPSNGDVSRYWNDYTLAMPATREAVSVCPVRSNHTHPLILCSYASCNLLQANQSLLVTWDLKVFI